jgi:phospholipase C
MAHLSRATNSRSIPYLQDTMPLRKFQAEVTSTSKPYDFAYTFIEPNYGDVVNKAAPLDNIVCGEWVIKFVYEAIRKSPLWNDS